MPKKKPPVRRKSCGTPGGYHQHWKHQEEACRDCKDAQNEKQRARYNPQKRHLRYLAKIGEEPKRKYTKRREAGVSEKSFDPPLWRPNCGTPAGRVRHYELGEQPCEPCREAGNAYMRARYNPVRQHCGTIAGWRVHRRMREAVCQACQDAHVDYVLPVVRKTRTTWAKGQKILHRKSHGDCCCPGAKKRVERNGMLLWICQACQEVWHSQPADMFPPPKMMYSLAPDKSSVKSKKPQAAS